MRRILIPSLTVFLGTGWTLPAQMHKVAKPEDVVRAVGVYEWIGDRAKPAASRLIPVTLFIDGSLQDAGVYLARPVPLALDTGNVYEIDKAGKPEGTLDLLYASHLQAADAAESYDDGWFGYGRFLPPAPPKKLAALKESKAPAKITSSRDDEDSDRPTLIRRPGSDGDATSGAKTAPAAGSGSGSGGSAAPQPADDPDRPHLTRKEDSSGTPDRTGSTQTGSTQTGSTQTGSTQTGSTQTQGQAAPDAPSTSGSSTSAGSTSGSSTAGGGTGSVPADDPDRPTLRKRSPEEVKKARKEAEESRASGLATSLNDDPNRPTLHRGKGQQAFTEADLPKLKGLPENLHQEVAVSDAKNRPVHDFSRPWTDDAERADVLTKMQALAQAQIAAYIAKNMPAPAASPNTAATKRTSATGPNSKPRRPKPPAPADPPAVPLEDESLAGYTLSYGGAPTFVYMAHTAGEGSTLRYVTVVAQKDAFGEIKPALQSVTDAAHLDRTPWMRLVDVVDAEASNRASLLFELRGQTARQFALYRVIAARPEQIFLSGTTQ